MAHSFSFARSHARTVIFTANMRKCCVIWSGKNFAASLCILSGTLNLLSRSLERESWTSSLSNRPVDSEVTAPFARQEAKTSYRPFASRFLKQPQQEEAQHTCLLLLCASFFPTIFYQSRHTNDNGNPYRVAHANAPLV